MGLQGQFSTPLDQAWLAFWVRHRPDSLLAKYLQPETLLARYPDPVIEHEPLSVELPAPSPPAPPRPRTYRPPPPRQPRPARPPSVPRPPSEARKARKVDREVARFVRGPISDWAKRLIGDERISHITLQDILDGVEDYFEIFVNLKKVDKSAYKYFSRVGAPIITENTYVWRDDFFKDKIPNPVGLPSFFGGFFPKRKERYRAATIKEKESGLSSLSKDERSQVFWDFCYFAKPDRRHLISAPAAATAFEQHSVFLDRRDSGFSKQELKRFPWVKKNFGTWWPIGVMPDGGVRALPTQMQRHQKLPSGDVVHHSGFMIPPGLAEMHSDCDAHEFVRRCFIIMVVFTASAVSGIQVTIKRGKVMARFGVPIANLKTFFADRDPGEGSSRRKAIIHLRLSHDRQLADGRVITVGEHLSGERFFNWRGYEIEVGVPGIHYPSPEGLDAKVLYKEDLTPEDDKDDMVGLGRLAKEYQQVAWSDRKRPIRKGEPVRTFVNSSFPAPTFPAPETIEHDPPG